MNVEISVKKILIIISMLIICSMAGTLRDSRDGKTYKTVEIGNQTWMAENLNYETDESMCYDKMYYNCKKYGRLYTWDEAQNVCPSGWHLPSLGEFRKLEKLADDIGKSGTVLKSTTGWKDENGKSGNGADGLGFGAMAAGLYHSEGDFFADEGKIAHFWSSTEGDSDRAYYLCVYESAFVSDYYKGLGYSVRCVKDSNEESEVPLARSSVAEAATADSAKTLKDSRDGKIYKTVKIGNQVWMSRNLNVNVPGSMCYDNDPANCEKYGRLYTWEAAMKACPDGWKLPDNSDFSELKTFVETKVGKGKAGSALKGVSFDKSVEGALEYDDRFGFSSQAAGDRFNNAYQFQGETAYLWSSSEDDDSRAFDWVLSTKSNDFFQGNIKFALKKNGFSVRCIKKSANNLETKKETRGDEVYDSNEGSETSSQRSQTQSSSAILKDSRDGKTYKTVKIGDQTWMAENLNYMTSESVCYDNKDSNCKKYGRLYAWEAAKNACPRGWHLPSMEEMENFLMTVTVRVDQIVVQKKRNAEMLKNGEDVCVHHLRASSWKYGYHLSGYDSFGFSALPAGGYSVDGFFGLGREVFFWSSTESEKFRGFVDILQIDDDIRLNMRIGGHITGRNLDMLSVRCLKD